MTNENHSTQSIRAAQLLVHHHQPGWQNLEASCCGACAMEGNIWVNMLDFENWNKSDIFLSTTYGRLICTNVTSNSILVAWFPHCLKYVTGSLIGKHGLGDRVENSETIWYGKALKWGSAQTLEDKDLTIKRRRGRSKVLTHHVWGLRFNPQRWQIKNSVGGAAKTTFTF